MTTLIPPNLKAREITSKERLVRVIIGALIGAVVAIFGWWSSGSWLWFGAIPIFVFVLALVRIDFPANWARGR